MGDITKNFSYWEFACKDDANTPVPQKYRANVRKLAEQLQVLRDEVGRISINSGYRTKAYNELIGGATYSQHLYGKAADIVCKDIDAFGLQALIETYIKTGKMKQGGLGKYSTFTHYDIRGKKARW